MRVHWTNTSIDHLLAIHEYAAQHSDVDAKRLVDRARSGGTEREDGPSEPGGRIEEAHSLPRREAAAQTYPGTGLAALQRLMWDHVGIERTREGLTFAADTLASWERRLPEAADRASNDLRNAVLTGRLIAEAALLREESRGAHYRSDFPESSAAWLKHLVFVR